MSNRERRPGQVSGKTKVTFYLADEVARTLRVRAAEEGRRQSEIVEELLRRHLEGRYGDP